MTTKAPTKHQLLKRAGYKVILKVTKTFTRGSLQGTTMDDEIPFMSLADATLWLEGASWNPRNNYRILSYDLINL